MKRIADVLPAKLRRLIRRPRTVSVLRLHGPIGAAARFSRGLSDQSMGPAIERAFAGKPAAVALSINSPGGSPVQSSLIAGRIRRLAEEKDVPVYAYLEDVAASGGYWLACAADEIIADPATITGSIGVISAGFGLQDFIARHGIERRVHATGANKAFMDPFQPEDPAQAERLEAMLGDLQDVFTAHVRARRGDRLAEGEEELFDGRVWVAARAQALGLIDGIGAMKPDLMQRFGEDVQLRVHGPKRGLFGRFGGDAAAGGLAQGAVGGFAQGAAEAAAAGALEAAETRAMWARWGI